MAGLLSSMHSLSRIDSDLSVHKVFSSYDMAKRHGHGNDVVDEDNIRQVAGCLPIDFKKQKILLISSRKHKNAWVIPKGGWERDETQKHAAQRETWEEAGVKGTIHRFLGLFEEATKKQRVKASHWIFEMEVESVAHVFPEIKKRERRWFSFDEALDATRGHPYIQEAIKLSSLNPTNTAPFVPAIKTKQHGFACSLLRKVKKMLK